MEILIKALQFILSLSILVVLHEFGHFFFAKLFKIRVEKFYLFFNPGFSLFKFKLGETEYGMGWVPFGGYVKISGMVDESMDTEQMKQPAQDYEFRSKPAWQRLLVMTGGVIMNIITAIIIYICLSFNYGTNYVDNNDVKDGYAFSELAHEIGFRNGDKIISVEGKTYGNFMLIVQDIIITSPKYVEVDRNGETVKIIMDESYIPRLLSEKDFMGLRMPMVVNSTLDPSIAKDAGIMPGDSLYSANGINMLYQDQFSNFFTEHAGETVLIGVMRNGEPVELNATLDDSSKIGIYVDMVRGMNTYNITYKKFTLTESIPEGFRRAKNMVTSYIDQMKLVFNPKTEAYKSVGSVISMGKIFSPVWDWAHFWNLTALYSVVLAVMNILPIPALDGGHVMFLLYEVVTRRSPNEKFLEYAQMVGMFLLLALIILALGNDIYKLFI